jgi:hypothetical protein
MSTPQEQTIKNISRDTVPPNLTQPKLIAVRRPTSASLGAESVRDGRPSTDDNVVEAMNE